MVVFHAFSLNPGPMNRLILVLLLILPISSCGSPNGDNKKQVSAQQLSGDTVQAVDSCIFVVYQAKNKDYWFGSDVNGAYRFDGGNIFHFTTKHGLPGNSIKEIKEYELGNVYFTTQDGISKFDGQKFTTLELVESGEWKLNSSDLWFKFPGKNGVGRWDGRTLYHHKFEEVDPDERYYQRVNSAISDYDVYYIYKDKSGHIWFGTGNAGIGRYDGKSLGWMYEDHLTNTPEGGSFGIRSMLEDKNGAFWFCNTGYRYMVEPNNSLVPNQDTPKDFKLAYERTTGVPNMRKAIYYLSITEDNEGRIWMCTYTDGVWCFDGRKMKHYPIKINGKQIHTFTIYKDLTNAIWLGTHENGVYQLQGDQFVRVLN